MTTTTIASAGPGHPDPHHLGRADAYDHYRAGTDLPDFEAHLYFLTSHDRYRAGNPAYDRYVDGYSQAVIEIQLGEEAGLEDPALPLDPGEETELAYIERDFQDHDRAAAEIAAYRAATDASTHTPQEDPR